MIKRFLTIGVLLGLLVSAIGCTGTNETTSPGDLQTIRVAAQGTFEPAAVAKAGIPLRLEFGPGAGCTAAIQFPELGIFEDLTDGGGVVDLPSLQAGEYPLICQADMVMGVLRVE